VTAADGTEDARFAGNTFSPNEQGHAVIAREFVAPRRRPPTPRPVVS
jgi:hypothetical protein